MMCDVRYDFIVRSVWPNQNKSYRKKQLAIIYKHK